MNYYIPTTADYWISPTAVSIVLNALGDANRIHGAVTTGAVIACFVDDIKAESEGGEAGNGDGLWYGANHQPKTWPLSLSPTYFNTDTRKYVYAAIPRTTTVGTQATIVFPSEILDIYGRAERTDGETTTYEQVGSTDYFYVYLHGIISAVTSGTSATGFVRTWEQAITDWGKLDTPQGNDEKLNDTGWYSYSKVTEVVTFLKEIIMQAGSSFRNLILGGHSLTSVAVDATTPVDSETAVVTPAYALSKVNTDEQTVAGPVNFEGTVTAKGGATADESDASKGIGLTVFRSATIGGILKVAKSILTRTIQSLNFSGGDSLFGTGWQLTDDAGNGRSRLVVDDMFVRGKFSVNTMEVRRLISVGGNFVISPANSVIEEVDYFTYEAVPGEEEPVEKLLGYSYAYIPWYLKMVPAFVANKVMARKKWVRTTMSDTDWSQVAFYRCWIKADDGSTQTINTWQVGMLARCQTFNCSQIENGTHSGTFDSPYGTGSYNNVTNKLYWRAVIATATGKTSENYAEHTEVLNDGKAHNYIDLSAPLALTGSDHCSAGDHIVCFGDYLNKDLANVISIETVGSDAPAIKQYEGVGYDDGSAIDWTLDDKLKTRISPKAGNLFKAPEFKIQTYDASGNVTNEQSMSEFVVDTNGILATVRGQIANGKNIVKGALTGNGWMYGAVTNNNTFDAIDDVTVDENSWMKGNGRYDGYIGPSVKLAAGTTYTFSFEPGGTFSTGTMEAGFCVADLSIYVRQSVTESGNRLYVTITPEASMVVRPFVSMPTDSWPFDVCIRYPQLELGSSATAFESSTTEMSTVLNITAEGFSTEVSRIKAGKNLLTGVLTGEGWKMALRVISTGSTTITGDVSIDEECWMSYSALSNMILSPSVSVVAGNTYTLSFESESTSAITIYTISGSSSTALGSTTSEAGRKSLTWTPAADATFRIGIAAKPTRYPQLELGDTATEFVAGSEEISSAIKMTSDRITAQVKSSLGLTGIDIDQQTIELRGNLVTFKNTDGTVSGKVSIDPTAGTLYAEDIHAVDGVFEGTLMYNKVITTSADIFTMYEIDSDNNQKLLSNILVVTGSSRTFTVILPEARFCPGARIKILNSTKNGHTSTPSPIEILVNYDKNEGQLQKYQLDADAWIADNIVSAVDFNYAYSNGDLLMSGGLDSVYISRAGTGNDYGILAHSTTRYNSIELVSVLNPFTVATGYYAWMIIDAKKS